VAPGAFPQFRSPSFFYTARSCSVERKFVFSIPGKGTHCLIAQSAGHTGQHRGILLPALLRTLSNIFSSSPCSGRASAPCMTRTPRETPPDSQTPATHSPTMRRCNPECNAFTGATEQRLCLHHNTNNTAFVSHKEPASHATRHASAKSTQLVQLIKHCLLRHTWHHL